MSIFSYHVYFTAYVTARVSFNSTYVDNQTTGVWGVLSPLLGGLALWRNIPNLFDHLDVTEGLRDQGNP